jgi:hypothetical protein
LRITELALFGSVLRDDFGPESDVDVLVTFAEDAPWDCYDLVEISDALSALFGRPVDLVERKALVNPFRRREILKRVEVLYAA